MSNPSTRLLFAVFLVPFAASCDRDNALPSTSTGDTQRIIAKQSEAARAESGDRGIDLSIGGERIHAQAAMSMGLRSSGEGDMTITVQASRLDGKSMKVSEVVASRLLEQTGSQRLGDGSGETPWIELSGVPGHTDARLRSIDGEIRIASFQGVRDGRSPAVDAQFDGRFVVHDGSADIDPAQAIPVSGRIRYASE